jgi:predicted unusual protein kinase regulating ubiquinone biosynthesis (AarF/ABC1/UbiB family)
VLTTELAAGLDLEAACQRSEEERAAWAETLWVFVFGSLLGHGLFNADPHPGNYLFADDGAIWFLDFGCTREVSAARLGNLRQAHHAACHGDDDTFVEQALAMMDLPSTGEQGRLARLYLLHCFEPIRAGGPYRLTRAYARSLFDEMKENAAAAMRIRRFVPLPAEWLFFNRLQLGFYSVLARLDVAVDYNAVERRLTEVASAPAAPAGGAWACDESPVGA